MVGIQYGVPLALGSGESSLEDMEESYAETYPGTR